MTAPANDDFLDALAEAEKLPTLSEMRALLMPFFNAQPSLRATPEFVDWCVRNSDKLVGFDKQ